VGNIEVAQISDREIGRLEATILQLEHRARNDRQAIFLMEDALFELRREVDTMKARMYTAVNILFRKTKRPTQFSGWAFFY
jgi:hypothetical protein